MRAPRGVVRGCFIRFLVPLLVFCPLLPFLLQSLSSAPDPPRDFHLAPDSERECTPSQSQQTLDNTSFCTGTCSGDCFPRVRNICFSSSKISICDSEARSPTSDGKDATQSSIAAIPHFMRFFGERLTVPVLHARCNKGWHWVSGLSAVADQRFLPYDKPNPHHEAEKIIPAVLLAKSHDTILHWFSDKLEVSEWAKGFIEAVGMEKKVRYLKLPTRHDDSICFHDAILLSSPTTLRYIPDAETNTWLRLQVLDYCKLPRTNVSLPISSAVILDRYNGRRRLGNKFQIAEVASQVLQVPVAHKISGMGSFCEQVSQVTDGDLFVVPHGSQNVVLLFARPGAVVIEVFPYLFYTTALRNYTHAAQVHVYTLLGLLPPGDWKLWLYSFFGWDYCYEQARWCKNYARRQPIYADLPQLERVLMRIQRENGSFT